MTHKLDLHDASSLTQIFCPKVEVGLLYDGDILGLSLRHHKKCLACSIQELADLIYPRNPKQNWAYSEYKHVLANVSRSRYVATATQPVPRLQIRPIVYN